MEKEKEQLRQQLQCSRHTRPIDHRVPVPPPTAKMIEVSIGSGLNAESDISRNLVTSDPNQQLALTDFTPNTMPARDATKARSLKSITVTSQEIDDLYQM